MKASWFYTRVYGSTHAQTLLVEVGPSCRQIPVLTQILLKTGCPHNTALVRGTEPRQKEGTDARLTTGSIALSPGKAQMAGVWERWNKHLSVATALGIIKRQWKANWLWKQFSAKRGEKQWLSTMSSGHAGGQFTLCRTKKRGCAYFDISWLSKLFRQCWIYSC